MGSELPTKVGERIEGVSIVESFLVFSVTAFDFAIMSGCVGTDELVADAQMDSGGFKQSRKITLAVRKTVGKLKTVVRLNTFDLDAASGSCSSSNLSAAVSSSNTLLYYSPMPTVSWSIMCALM